MTDAVNPYQSEADGQIESAGLSLRHRLVGLAAAAVVFLSSAVTMLAFLFGILVAVTGTSVPSPVDARLFLNEPLRMWSLTGLTVIVFLSLALATYVMFRILRMQRLLLETGRKRQDLIRQIDQLREAQRERDLDNPR